MSFCKYSSERTIIDSVKVNNIFITEYLTLCPDGAVKTYLMGLYFCNHPTHPNNSLNSFILCLLFEAIINISLIIFLHTHIIS